MSLIRQLAGHTVVYGLGHIISRILYFVVLTTYLTNRFPDTKDYGIYSELYAYASLFIVIFSYRIDTAFFRFGSKKENRDRAFNTAFIPLILTTILIIAIVMVNASLIASWIGYGDRPQYIRWFALILGFDVLALMPFANLRLQNMAVRFMGYKILNIIITTCLIFFFLEFYVPNNHQFLSFILPNIASDIDYVFISNLVASMMLFLILIFSIGELSWKVDWELWKKMVRYSLPLIIVGVAGSFNQFFAVPLQKFLLGNSFDENLTQAGIYAAPQRIAALLALFTTAFNYAAEPFFFKNADRKEAKDLYGKICLLFVMIGGLAILFIIYFLDLFQLLIGSNYREGIVIIPILLFAYLLLGVYYNISIWYKLSDKTHYGAVVSTIGAAITFFFSLFFLPKIGYIASAWAALICYLIMNTIVYFLGQKKYPIHYPVTKILMVFLMLIIFTLMGMQLDSLLNGVFSYLIKILMLISYLVIVFFMDKESILALVRGTKNK